MTEPAPPWTNVGLHALSPVATHDEIARFNFLANFNKYMAASVVSGNAVAYICRAKPAYEKSRGRAPADRREVREAMRSDSYYQTWSAMRRAAMEMRQQAGRSLVLRQAIALANKAAALNAGATTLRLNPVNVPRYQAAVDNHCMPGSYYAEQFAGDVTAAANYDCGMFATTVGLFGRYLDGAGRGTVRWLGTRRPDWQPQRILDLGCGIGHNTVPLARAYPQAEVVAVDLSAAMLRYGHARARGMGIRNIHFVQANVEQLPYADASFDFLCSTMFLHETSWSALRRILAEAQRLMAPGGLQVHLEQPPYRGMPIFEQFLRDWDCYNNNEPFWTTLNDTHLPSLLQQQGIAAEHIFETTIHAVVDDDLPKVANEVEDFGRGGMWYAVGVEQAHV